MFTRLQAGTVADVSVPSDEPSLYAITSFVAYATAILNDPDNRTDCPMLACVAPPLDMMIEVNPVVGATVITSLLFVLPSDMLKSLPVTDDVKARRSAST
jgi:hypothetical protein